MKKFSVWHYQVFRLSYKTFKSFQNFLFYSYKSQSLQKSCLQIAMNILKREKKPRQFPQYLLFGKAIVRRKENKET